MNINVMVLVLLSIILCQCSSDQIEPSPIRDAHISAHRCGPTAGFPENALETMQQMSKQIPNIMLEVDVRSTVDDSLILLHDKTLDRTTTGHGVIKDISYADIQHLKLIDHIGDTVDFKIPKFSEILDWLSNNKQVYLSLDIKENNLFAPVIEMVRQKDLMNQVEVICYTQKTVDQVYKIDPKTNISATIRNKLEFDKLINSKVPPAQVSAFTGLSISRRSFYDSLRAAGMTVTLGSLGNLDQSAATRGDHLYQEWKNLGVDRFATDRPIAVHQILLKK